MRTQAEITARTAMAKARDMLGFEWHEYCHYLDTEHIKPFLNDDAYAEKWKTTPIDRDALYKEMQEYLNFAWEKANSCRGISANRSIMHYIAWTWLRGDDDLCQKLEHAIYGGGHDEEYQFYGKPQLVAICEHYRWDWRALDDGKWRNDDITDEFLTADEALQR